MYIERKKFVEIVDKYCVHEQYLDREIELVDLRNDNLYNDFCVKHNLYGESIITEPFNDFVWGVLEIVINKMDKNDGEMKRQFQFWKTELFR